MKFDDQQNPRVFARAEGENTDAQKGMTLLDYFAGQALGDLTQQYTIVLKIGDEATENMAREDYALAAAMLKERDKYIYP